MTIQWDVLGFGAVAVDDVVYVDHYPLLDCKAPIRSEQRVGGGLAGTALVACSRLGAKAAYCGVLGDDELSRFTLQELEREGVDCGPVVHRAEAGPFHSVVIVDQSTAQRCVLYSGRSVMEPRPEEITPELIAQCRTLFVDNTAVGAGLRASSLARGLQIPVVADIESLDDSRLPELIRRIDHLILGLELATRLSGETEPASIARTLARDRVCCAVTAGARGCWYSECGGEAHHFPAFPVNAVDTLGCGDVFHGAYAASIARGDSVARAIVAATGAAGLKATRPGGRAGIPDRATLDRFLKEHGID
jgi:sugar/nucleoside kinase (ribokinase family)